MIERAANVAFDAAASYLEAGGSSLESAFILLEAKAGSLPEAEDQVAAAFGVSNPADLVAMLAVHFTAAAESCGMQVQILPMKKTGRG